MEMKRCIDCGRLLQISKFEKHCKTKDGLTKKCSGCLKPGYLKLRYSFGNRWKEVIKEHNNDVNDFFVDWHTNWFDNHKE